MEAVTECYAAATFEIGVAMERIASGEEARDRYKTGCRCVRMTRYRPTRRSGLPVASQRPSRQCQYCSTLSATHVSPRP